YHVVGGPVTVEKPRYKSEVKDSILRQLDSLATKYIRDGQRCNSAKAYLVPAENRTNLDIVSYAYVTKILMQNKQATGVQFHYKGINYKVKARREVIMSAGVIKTPQILMLSGIGPREHLQKFNKIQETTLGIIPEIFQKVFGSQEDIPILMCAVHPLQPKSRGTIRLKSNNPYDHPLIDPNYLEDPRDVKDMVTGLKVCQKFAKSKPMQKVGLKPFNTTLPDCESYLGDEDLYIECLARSIVISISQAVGTNKMGNPADSTTVVDSQLRVKGIKGLRVVDASIMPIIPSANTNIPTIMIAEKASDIIKEAIQCGFEGDWPTSI
ncbi:glucose dehydrogenase, partial [Caerostris extrusa]